MRHSAHERLFPELVVVFFESVFAQIAVQIGFELRETGSRAIRVFPAAQNFNRASISPLLFRQNRLDSVARQIVQTKCEKILGSWASSGIVENSSAESRIIRVDFLILEMIVLKNSSAISLKKKF